jgi:hypothetical protein
MKDQPDGLGHATRSRPEDPVAGDGTDEGADGDGAAQADPNLLIWTPKTL